MARKRNKRGRKGGRKRAQWVLLGWWPSARTRRRLWRAVKRGPRGVKIALGIAVLSVVAVGVNWLYQVVRKPSELFFPISGSFYKTPAETWRAYGAAFDRHSTAVMTPDLLAAIAQTEGSGNPIVRTYWRFSLTNEPFEIFRPASSAVGMYQITDGTFSIARRYCIHDHRVVEQGPWYDFRSCWFNVLYTRTVPSHAIELTSAYLDRGVEQTLQRHGVASATLGQKQALAALMHLCGPGAAAEYVRRGLRLTPAQQCGDHDVRGYVERVASFQQRFRALAADD